MNNIAIIGAGAWGTALAMILQRVGKVISIQAREHEVVESINNQNENLKYFKGHKLSSKITATRDPKYACKEADCILLVTPSQHIRTVANHLKTFLEPQVPILCCAKGIEQASGLLMSEIIVEILPKNALAILSGPTFANDVALNLPTAVTLACENQILANMLSESLRTPHFRIYTSTDIIGTQIGGAVKNVLAIACGIIDGKKMGDNARAALLTRGLNEIIRLAKAKGAKSETLIGLSGLGDLTLTCNSTQSRNFTLGRALGQGEKLESILRKRNSVAEGVLTAESIVQLSKKLNIDMPICSAVNNILNYNKDIDQVIFSILNRPLIPEVI